MLFLPRRACKARPFSPKERPASLRDRPCKALSPVGSPLQFAPASFAHRRKRSILICMAGKRGYRAITRIDPKALAEFQAAIRKRYSDDQILEELRACAERLGRSP